MVVEFAATDANGLLLGAKSTNVLVDSGADLTMLNADLAVDLGLDIATMNEATVGGVGGETTVYEPTTPVFASLCGEWTHIPMCFEVGRDMNLLGRAGAFDSMCLAFLHNGAVMLACRS
jgi:hypothetical protein